MTYTNYCLTDAMLRRLSAIVNESPQHGHGVSLQALERRELVKRIDGATYPRTHQATDTGRWALQQARREGW
jgi:hypothetical protein